MNNENLLVSSEQAIKALFDLQAYCNQQNDCKECKLYYWCSGLHGLGTIPAFWEMEKINK